MCLPFVSLHLSQSLHVSAARIGAAIGLMTFLGLPVQLIGGTLIDRYGRRPVLLVGAGASMVTYLAIAFAPALWVATLALGVEAVCGWSLVLTANNALTADLAPPGRQTEAFGLRTAATGAGNALGPLAASLVLKASGSLHVCFLAGVSIIGLFATVVALFLRESKGQTADWHHIHSEPCLLEAYPQEPNGGRHLSGASLDRPDEHAHSHTLLRPTWWRVVRNRRLILFLLATLPATSCYAQVFVTLPIMLRDVHHLSAQRWGLMLSVFAITTSVLTVPLTRAVGHRNGVGVVAAGCLLMAGSLATLAVVPTSPMILFPLMTTLAAGVCFHISAAPAVVARMTPPDVYGRAMGAWGFAYVGAYGLGALVGGWALDALGPQPAYLTTGAVGAVGAGLLAMLARGRKTGRQRKT